MKVSVELTKEELVSCFGEDQDWHKKVEISVGKEMFSCYVVRTQMRSTAFIGMSIQIDAEGSSKRLQDIADAKALVNKTKEAHKEAQRKLAELTEGK